MKKIERRRFLSTTCATVAGAVIMPYTSLAASFNSNDVMANSFSFVFMGDLHFDKFEHHDVAYMKDKYPNDIRQVINYSHLTWETLPELFRTVKNHADELNAAFFLQLGDFLEGLCGSKELATKQATDFIQFVASHELKRPFIVTKGNHDITGTGAKEVYEEVIIPWQAKELKREISSSNVSFVYENTRFIMLDGYNGETSLKWLKADLENHEQDHLFICVHEPVVPYNARSNWHLFSRNSQNREELINLLGKHKAIVLTAHLHDYSVVARNTPNGNFVQIGIGSVIPATDNEVKVHMKGLENYNSTLVELEPEFSPTSLETRKEILDREAKFIRHFEFADFCGYGDIKINSNNEVIMSVYANVDKTPWNTVNLTNLLNL